MSYKQSETPDVIEDIKNSIMIYEVPAAGDASTIIARTLVRKNYGNTDISEELYKKRKNLSADYNQCSLLMLSNNLSISIINTALNSHAKLIQHGILGSDNQSDLLSVESCGFPYYRSYKSCGRVDDIVLVKDTGVSCTILNPDTNTSKNAGRCSSVLESFLISQLKIECKDLSDITRRITSCTKDILQSLSLKKKNQDNKIFSSNKTISRGSETNSCDKVQPIAMQYTDKTGLPCLKLRLVKCTKFSSLLCLEKLSKSCWNFVAPKKESEPQMDVENERNNLFDHTIVKKHVCRDGPTTNKGIRNDIKSKTPSHHVKQVRQIYPKEPEIVEFDSLTCSSSSIYDFRMARNETTLIKGKTKQIAQFGLQNDRCTNSDPLSKNRIRKGLKETVPNFPIHPYKDFAKNTKSKSLSNCQKIHRSLQSCKEGNIIDQQLSWNSVTKTNNPFPITTKSHTVNIRIVKHKRGYCEQRENE